MEDHPTSDGLAGPMDPVGARRSVANDTRARVEVAGSRRSFFRRSALASTLALPGLALAAAPALAGGKGKKGGNLPNLYPNWNASNFLEILLDEEAHIEILTGLADNPRPKPTFVNLETDSPRAFAEMAAMIENGGVGSYLGGVVAISTGGHDEYLATAAGILAIEARHTGYLNTLLDDPIVPNDSPIDTIITQQVIRKAIMPLIVSFNGGPPWMYDPNGNTDANDQLIINFQLVLEFLEVEFYRTNFLKFFA